MTETSYNFFLYRHIEIGSNKILHIKDKPIRKINNNENLRYFKKILNETYHNINNLTYTINNNNSNEFIINITNFNTLYSFNSSNYFEHDVSKTNKIPVNNKKYKSVDNRWKMNF